MSTKDRRMSTHAATPDSDDAQRLEARRLAREANRLKRRTKARTLKRQGHGWIAE